MHAHALRFDVHDVLLWLVYIYVTIIIYDLQLNDCLVTYVNDYLASSRLALFPVLIPQLLSLAEQYQTKK